MLLGLGLPEWLTLFGLVGGLVLTFWVMAKASIAYDKARRQREPAGALGPAKAGPSDSRRERNTREKANSS